MNTKKAQQIAGRYGLDLWYEPAIRRWVIEPLDMEYQTQAHHIAPTVLRAMSESRFRELYLVGYAEEQRFDSRGERVASREEQQARYMDCGPLAWDDCDSPSGDY